MTFVWNVSRLFERAHVPSDRFPEPLLERLRYVGSSGLQDAGMIEYQRASCRAKAVRCILDDLAINCD